MRRACLLTTVVALLGIQWAATRHLRAGELEELAQRAVSNEGAEAAIAELRARGPAGLDALFAVHAAAIKRGDNGSAKAAKASPVPWERLRHALDSVSGQRDCHASHLYWYTDLDEAEAAARQAHKPILSLRLLGKLSDEYSCANSRYFRATLYSNKEISDLLRQRFVLHWQTVRPAPVVTIDFGDGRKLVRTVTGNSIHYVLSPDGQPLDALPGLYGPAAFARWLGETEKLAQAFDRAGSRRAAGVAEYHRRRSQQLEQAWQRDLKQSSLPTSMRPEELTDVDWQRLASFHAADAQLDAASRRLIASHHPMAAKAGNLAISKAVVELPLVRLVRELQGTIALDTVRNDYQLHRRIHDWFAAGPVGPLGDFNERVYAELFLTPSSDPWLGLLPEGYTGLENDGVVASAER